MMETAISLRGVRKQYDGFALRDIDLTLPTGQVMGLVGINGAGKSTLLRLLMGLVRADGGTVALGPHALTALPVHLRARLGLGYLAQEPTIFRKLSVRENFLAALELSSTLGRPERERQAEKRAIDREVRESGRLQQAADPHTSPSRQAIRSEQRQLLEQALEQLPEEQRAAVRLKYLEQATLSETAQQLGKSEDAVSGLLQRGMARLSRILRDLETGDS